MPMMRTASGSWTSLRPGVVYRVDGVSAVFLDIALHYCGGIALRFAVDGKIDSVCTECSQPSIEGLQEPSLPTREPVGA